MGEIAEEHLRGAPAYVFHVYQDDGRLVGSFVRIDDAKEMLRAMRRQARKRRRLTRQ